MVTESDTKEIVPRKKFVPAARTAEAPNVRSKTGTSAYVEEVKTSTERTTTTTRADTTFISSAIISAAWSPMDVLT